MVRVIAAGIVLLIVVAGGTYYWLTSGELVHVSRVQPGQVQEFVDEQGKTRLPQVHLITMPQAGRIEEIELEEGDQVKRGQVVAQISPLDLELAVSEAQAAVDRLSASLEENADISVELSTREQSELFVDSMKATVEAAEARQQAGKSRLDFAESFLARVRRLFQTGARTEDQVDRAELEQIESQVNYQQDVLITQAMQSILAATQLLPKMVTDYIARKALSGNVLEKQKAEAEARLRQALLQQQRGTLRSPVDGIVLNRLITDEQFLSAGTTLLEIGKLQNMEVEADVLSEDVVRIKAGDFAEIYGPAVGKPAGEGLPAVVQRIFPAGFTKVSSLGVEQQRVKVIISLEPAALSYLLQRDVGVDYRVRVRILTEAAENARVVPRSSLFRGADGQWYVYIVQERMAKLRRVEVGLLNDDRAQVTDGLNEDQLVVLSPESSLQDGDRVRIANAD